MAKQWMLVKNHDGVGHGVYVRDIPAVIASAVGEKLLEWWDENGGNVFWFTVGMGVMSAVMLCAE